MATVKADRILKKIAIGSTAIIGTSSAKSVATATSMLAIGRAATLATMAATAVPKASQGNTVRLRSSPPQ